MLKLIVLITLISGVSTRGVPKADDNAELEPKGIETDQKDHSSEHDNLTECEDCIKSSEDDDGEDDIFLERKNEGGDIGNDGLDVLKATPKRKRTRRIKSFLTFHRINVNVNRDRHVRRKISSERKEKPENTSKGTNTQIKEEKDQIDNDNGQTETSLENNGHRRKSKSKTATDSKHSSKVTNAHLRKLQRTVNTDSNTNSDEINVKPKESHSKTKSNSKHKSKETEKGHNVNIEIAETNLSTTKATYETKVNTHKETTNSKTTTDITENVAPVSTYDTETTNDAVDTRKETTTRLNKPNEKAVQKDLHGNIHLGSSENDKMNKNIINSAKYAKADNENKDQVPKNTVDHILGDKVDNSDNSEQKAHTNNIQSETFNSETKATSKDKKEEKENISNTRSTKKPKQGKNTQTKRKSVDKSEDSEKKSTEKPNDEKDNVDRIIPKNSRDRWSRKGLSQVPDVERLERRLHPAVDAPVSDIIRSMKNMLRLIQSSLYRVNSDFMMIQNTTRWKYMVGVRNQLTELSEENDEIYDVVMESSLLTKQIYRQAHERKHPRSDIEAVAVSYRSRLNTNMHPQIRKHYHEAQRELEIAKRLIEQIKGIRNKKDSLVDEEMRIHHLVRDKLPMRSMHDLYRRADQTIRVLSAAQPLSRYGDKSRLYGHMRNDTDLNMKRARELTVEGFDLLTHAKRVLLENRQKVQEHSRMVRHRLPAGTVSDMPFDSGRMDLFVAWDEANHHANSLSETAAEIHMKFDPLIKKAKEVIENSAGVEFKKQFEQSIAEMKETVKRFLKTLDSIRVVIGDERILQERCEDIQSSGLFLDVKGSPINCDPYQQETLQGSGDGIDGSGDDDDTFVDTEITKMNKSDVVDEKASVDVDKPEESFIDIDAAPPKESAIDTDITNPDESSVDVDITQPKNKSVDVDITKPKESPVIKDRTKPTASSVDIGATKPNKTDQIDKTNTLKPSTVSKIDGTDDEDIAHELKAKMTQKTTTTPATTTEVTTESATEGSDEDFVFDPFGWFNDEADEESILLGTEDDLTGLVAVPSNMTLNEHIRARLYNYSQGSKRILEAAQTNASKMEEISLTWKKVQDRFSTLKNKTMNGIATISKWEAERAYFQAVHIRVKGVSDDIILKKEVVEEQCSNAVEAANKKLKDMTKVYEKQSEKAKNAADPTDVNEAVTQVKVVIDNVKEIDRLKQLYPTPCGTLERLDRKIRTNITELRKKIEKAKLIASSLQIAVSVPKKGYLEFPISDIPLESHPLTSQAQMMLKHTGSDGRLLSMHAGESESISLDVQTDGLTVVQSIDGDESSHNLYADKIENQWYLIQLHRYAASYNVTMIGENGVLGKVGLPNSLDGQRPFTKDLLPTALRVGASGEDLSACALGIEINGRSVNMFDMSKNKSFPTPCSSQGRWTSNQPQLLLDGSGYAAISFDDIRLGRTLQSIKVSFKPRSDGTVIFLQPERMATVIDVYVEKGLLVVFVHYRGFETKLKSTVEVYGNNQILEISFKSGRTKGANVVLNGKSNVFKSAKGGKRGKQSSSKHIFIGGFRGGNSSSSMVGCIKSLEVNGEEIPFHNIHEAEGHSYGSCRETECIMFDDNSIPIELTNLTLVQAVHVSVRRGSLGPVIQYSKHKEKFNLEISVNTEGVHVEETVKENDEDLSLNRDSEFIVITIQDDTEDKSVTVTVDGESEEFSYGNGGGWGGGWGGNGNKDDEGPVSYSISMATSSEDSPQFIGSIQNLILDGRPVDLIRYVESNQLGRCTVDPAPRKTTIPDTASKGITCQ